MNKLHNMLCGKRSGFRFYRPNSKWVFCFLFAVGAALQTLNAAPAKEANTQQQTKSKVTGSVLDEKGEPLIGVTILIKGQTVGTVTDINGKYSLTLSSPNVLVVTYIGYKKQSVNYNGQSKLDIKMEPDATNLNEVVVVGYGTQRVKDMTGAASPVKLNDISQLPGASIVDALAGQVVGLSVTQSNGRPGATGSLKVRQPVSFDASSAFNQPLIVIDDVVQINSAGEPDMTAFNMLDMSEIEDMTVLKDASAAIYGSRASAGVILIKTKRGKIGTPQITYSSKLDYSDAVSHIKTMSAYETGVFTNRMINQTYANNGSDYRNNLYSDDELNAMKSLNYNWLDRAWKPALSQRHGMTVNGGSDKVTYFAGINYQDQATNLGNVQSFDKWTFRAGGEMKISNGLKLSAAVSGYNAKTVDVNNQASISKGPWGSQSGSQDYVQLNFMPKYIPIEASVLDPLTQQYKNYYVSPWFGPISVNTSTDANVGKGNAVWNFFANQASKARKTSTDNGYNANFSLSYDVPFIKGLSVKGTYSVSYANSFDDNVGDYYTLARATNTNLSGKHLIGDYTTWNFINFGDPNGTNLSNKPTVIYNKKTSKTEQMNLMVNYIRKFGKHDISLTGVIERSEGLGEEEQLYYRGLGATYTGASYTAGTLSTNGAETYLQKTESGALSYIGRASYKYADRYLLQLLARVDASTKFAPENYWGYFPAASAGWVISEEKFFKNSFLSKSFDYMKLRYSIGKTGKDNVPAWYWMQMYNINPSTGLAFGPNGGQYTNGANLMGTANRDIKWDNTIKNNVGIDLNVLSNRLSFSADYYYDRTKDLIMLIADSEEPIYIGAKLPYINYGKKDAWGWEFSAKWSDKIKQNLNPVWGPIRYGIGMDFSLSWNKTVLGQAAVFDFPGYIDTDKYTGYHSPSGVWGFKTWKNTSSGDGMLRTQADIDKYWQYLTDLATAAGRTPSYLGITSKSQMYPGMIAYTDIAGAIDATNKTIAGPDGTISREHADDYVKLADNIRYGVNTKLNLQWGNLSWSSQISTSWGGFSSIDHDVKQSISSSEMIWSQLSYVNDMFDPTYNPNGKYPSMAVASAYGEMSDFWQVSSFRCYVRNMTLGYSLPKKAMKKIGIDKLQVNLTGNNLWDFYNPYTYRNMYDSVNSGYPTLRTWTLGVDITF